MAKIIDCVQGEEAWLNARLGIPTASEAHRIVTPTGKLSAQSRAYAYRLIAEELLQQQTDSLDELDWVAHGKLYEGDAVKVYEFLHDVETTKVGFVTTDNGTIGASPDRLVTPSVGLECKCPAPQTHIGYLLDGLGDKYKPQVQTQIYVCEFEKVDFFSHNVSFRPVEISTYRDDAYIKILSQALKDFVDMKAEMMERIRKEGFFVEREKITTAVENEYGENLNW